ncbi:hypothetical protein O1611_g7825 [Lasiodiplodia mahajangana]|uniref:Uncharacterized protein n=1 Tax=Lasiodiplodia mahajangana TaxID=1108764 RepID=A0ACC2JF05_9PEZI|nr:hypothetical protein O1611_g7825 [Lasiodiplodia mahajangana]
MQTRGSILAIAGLVSSALAAAIPTDNIVANADNVTITVYPDGLPADLIPGAAGIESIEKRADAGVYLCTDSYFTGYCVHIVQPQYVCINLSGDLNDKVSSVGPDSPYYCLFYGAFNCDDSESHFGTFSPGYNDLTTLNYNDKISSYICHPN